MRSKKTKIVKELDPQEVEGLSQARIEHYLVLGYRPYLDEKSHIKWLTQAQMSMRGISSHRVSSFRRMFPKRPVSRYRKKRSRRSRFHYIREYWLPALMLLIVIAFLIVVFVKPDLIF